MPKIETYDAPQVASRGYSGRLTARATPDAFGSSIAQGLSNVSDAMDEIKRKDDEATIKKQMSEFRRQINEAQFTGDDAYYTRQGENAYRSMSTQMKMLDEIRKANAKNLTPEQAEKFEVISREYLDRENTSMSRHAAKGRVQWQNDSDTAAIQQAQEDGSLRYSDSKTYSDQIRAAVRNISNRNGWPSEKADLEIERHLSAMHKTAIDNMMANGNATEAENYFSEHREDILPSMQDDIKRQIDGQADAQWSQNKADEIRVAGGSRADRLAAVNEIEDEGKRKLVRSQVLNDYKQEKAALEEAQIESFDEALKAGMSGVSGAQWKAANPEKWDSLTAKQQQAIMSGSAPKTDIQAYYKIKAALASGDMDLAREELAKNLHRISNGDQKKLVDQMFKPVKTQPNIEGDKAAFNRNIEALLGARPSASKGEKRKEWQQRYDVLFGYYVEQIEQWQESTGKKYITTEDRDKILDRMMIEGVQEDGGWFWFDKEITIADIPAEDLKEIESIIKERGEPLTPENIMRYATHVK